MSLISYFDKYSIYDIVNNFLYSKNMKYLLSHKCMTIPINRSHHCSDKFVPMSKGTHRPVTRHNHYRIRLGNWSPQSKQILRLLQNYILHIFHRTISFPLYCKFVLIINKVNTSCTSEFLTC